METHTVTNLIEISGSGWKIIPTKEAEKLKMACIKQAGAIKVVKDKESEVLARAALGDLASFRKQLEATRKQVKQPVLDLGKRIDTIANDFGSAVDDEEKRIKGLIGDYAVKVERERLRIEEEARKLREEEERKVREAEAARRKAEQTASPLAEAKADKLEAKVDQVAQAALSLELKADETRVKGASFVWEFEVLDIEEVYDNRPDLVHLEAKRREILDAIAVLELKGQAVEIGGLRIFKKPRVRA